MFQDRIRSPRLGGCGTRWVKNNMFGRCAIEFFEKTNAKPSSIDGAKIRLQGKIALEVEMESGRIQVVGGVFSNDRHRAPLGEIKRAAKIAEGRKVEGVQQSIEFRFGAVEIAVMPQLAFPAGFQPWLIGIHFPRVDVKDKRPAFFPIDISQPVCREAVGIDSEIASPGDRDIGEPLAADGGGKLKDVARGPMNDMRSGVDFG